MDSIYSYSPDGEFSVPFRSLFRRTTSQMARISTMAVAALCGGLLITGCSFTDVFSSDTGGSSPPAATATAEPESRSERGSRPTLGHRYFFTPATGDYDANQIPSSPEAELLADAADRWSETDTVSFELDVDGTTYLDVNETIELESVDGVLKRPDQAEAEATVKIGFATFDVGLVAIGNDVYMTNFLNGDWERGPDNFDFNPALIFDDDQGVSAVLEAMDDVEIGNEATIGGTEVTEISGVVDQDDIDQLVAGSLEGEKIEVTLWIDAQTGDLYQIELAEPDDVDGDPISWVITFSDHNQPVTIEAPDI